MQLEVQITAHVMLMEMLKNSMSCKAVCTCCSPEHGAEMLTSVQLWVCAVQL